MDVILIGGVSGSGKSVALGALEDSGYYAVANLPLSLVAETADFLRRAGQDRIAVTFDLKTGAGLDGVPEAMAALRAAGWSVRFLVLDAKTDTLVKRFSETRRRHPFSSEALTLTEAIEFERALLADVRELALRLRHQRPGSRSAAQLDQGLRVRRCVAVDAAVRVVRLQARRAAGCRPRIRRPLPSEPALRAGAFAADRTRRAGRRVPRARAGGRANVRRHLSFRRRLAARLRSRQPQLPHRGDRLHRRTSSFRLFRRAAGARVRAPLPGAEASPRDRSGAETSPAGDVLVAARGQ